MADAIPLLPREVREAWLISAARGHPPAFRDFVELELGLAHSWWHAEAIAPMLTAINPSSPRKTLMAVEASRGAGKSLLLAAFRLWLCAYVIPFLTRPGLPLQAAQRQIVLFGRDERHIREDILGPIADLVIRRMQWMRTPKWETMVEDTDNPTDDDIRALSEMRSKGSQKWEALRLDFANGTSIRTRTLRQSVRGLHSMYVDFDDVVTETNFHESASIKSDVIQGAVLPAIEPGGLLAVWGTPQSPSDLYDLLKADPDWHYRSYPAVDVDGVLGYASKNPPDTREVDRACLWPARLSMAALEQARGSTRESEIKFAREYNLERVTDTTSLVYPEDILAARDNNLSYEHTFVPGRIYYAGCDPSGRLKDEAGFAMGFVTEQMRTISHLSKLGVDRRLAPGEGELSVVDRINDLSIRFNCYDWTVEGNGAQRVLIPLTRRLNPSIRSTAFMLGSNKHTEANGWLGIRTVFRSRLVKLPYATAEDRATTDEFIHQLRGIQYVNGEIVEDPKRRNDLISAFFLFLKASEKAVAQYSMSTLKVPTHSQGPIGISLPQGPTHNNPAKPSPRGELSGPAMPDRGSLQSIHQRLAKWQRRR